MEVYARLTLPELFQASPHSLVENVTWVPPTDKHWVGGIQYDTDCTDADVTSSPCISGAPDSSALTKSATFSQVTRGSRAFTVYAEVDCTPDRQFWDSAEQSAKRALTVSAPDQIEQTFWTGSSGAGAPIFPNLTTTGPIYDSTGDILLQPSSTIISGQPLDLVEGIGRLEEAFHDCYHGLGVIHAPVVLSTDFARRGMYEHGPGNTLVTSMGNRIVFGTGYPINVGSGGVAPPLGSAWVFMTSPVFGIRGPVRTFRREESFDRGVNTLKMIAEQTIVLGWECCLAGVLLTVGGDLAGSPFSALQAF